MSAKKAEGGAAESAVKTGEAIRRLLDGLEPGSLEEAFAGDPGLAREVIEKAGLMEMALVRVMRLTSEYLDGLEPAERAQVIRNQMAAYDGDEIATALNAFSGLMMKVRAESPEIVEDLFPLFERVITGTDFGKLREATAAGLDYFTEYMTAMIDALMKNPVVIANVAGMIPPVANSLIRVMYALIDKIGLPPEILASALFNTITALDAEELGRLVTSVSQLAIDLHAGNYILGGSEPRFRSVATDFLKRVMDNLDPEAVNSAVVAVAEDLEVLAGVVAELNARDPELVVLMAGTATEIGNIAARVMTSALSEANAWPDELLARIGEAAGGWDALELGRAIDLFVTLALRMREVNPDLHRDALAGVLQGVNTERIELLASNVAADAREAILSNAGVRRALEPEEMGRRVNLALVRFNRSAASRPGAFADYATRLFEQVETEELERAVRTVAHGTIDALMANARRAKDLCKLGLSGALRMGRLLLKAVMKQAG